MLSRQALRYRRSSGTSLIEVLVTLLILAFGLLGIAGLQSKIQLTQFESYQRSQALLVLSDMAERISANRAQAGAYVSNGALGTGDSQPASCTNIAAGPNRDLCEWSNTLKGASERKSAANVGAMLDARGCITQLQAPDPTPGICTPGIYRVAVAWQGMLSTTAPAIACGQGSYGANTYRRVIAAQVSVGLPSCF
jgi:type IV pilus assembly protein PilV